MADINMATQGESAQKKRRFHNKKKAKKVDNYEPNAPKEILDIKIEELELSEKTYNSLKEGGVITVRDLAKRRMSEMYRIKNISKKNCFEILKKLEKYNVTFRDEERAVESAQTDAGQEIQDGKNVNRERRDVRIEEKKADKRLDRREEKRPDRNKRNDSRDAAPREEIDKDELIKFYRKKKWGFKDWQNKEVIAPEFDEAFPFREDLACVERDEKLGYIDKKGEIVIPFLYDSALSFSEGLASVTIGDKSGYIDKEGNTVFPLEYDSATSFYDGKAIIKKDGRWGFLNKEGEIRWK